jgi:hypothetical protein
MRSSLDTADSGCASKSARATESTRATRAEAPPHRCHHPRRRFHRRRPRRYQAAVTGTAVLGQICKSSSDWIEQPANNAIATAKVCELSSDPSVHRPFPRSQRSASAREPPPGRCRSPRPKTRPALAARGLQTTSSAATSPVSDTRDLRAASVHVRGSTTSARAAPGKPPCAAKRVAPPFPFLRSRPHVRAACRAGAPVSRRRARCCENSTSAVESRARAIGDAESRVKAPVRLVR